LGEEKKANPNKAKLVKALQINEMSAFSEKQTQAIHLLYYHRLAEINRPSFDDDGYAPSQNWGRHRVGHDIAGAIREMTNKAGMFMMSNEIAAYISHLRLGGEMSVSSATTEGLSDLCARFFSSNSRNEPNNPFIINKAMQRYRGADWTMGQRDAE
jgi:hypothetical protein